MVFGWFLLNRRWKALATILSMRFTRMVAMIAWPRSFEMEGLGGMRWLGGGGELLCLDAACDPEQLAYLAYWGGV